MDEKVNILLVDDQPAKLLSYQAILEDLGENLVPVQSGPEALQQLLRSDFAVILVDVCMPEQDGFELVEMIRSHHRFRKTAIIFVSAVQMTDMDRLKGYASGAVDYVSVPIVPEILRAKVAVFVDLYRKTRQLEVLNQELEQRVLERTAQLTETQEALTESNRRKDVFLATLAHELRNPLAPMLSAVELLRQPSVTAEAATFATDVMVRQLRQMSRLVDDLLDLNRITRNSMELRQEHTDLASILIGAIETAQPAIDAAGQRLTIDLPESAVHVFADRARLSQVVSNLLSNASKYSPAGGDIKMAVSADGDTVTLTVSDNGIGVDAHDIDRLFEPFFQVRHAKDQPNNGLGIGLTLVHMIIELHNGTVEARSDGPGTGTAFYISLPVSKVQLLADVGELEQKGDLDRMFRILVVDDNPDAARSLSLLLEQLGHTVATAENGKDAIESVSTFEPDVVIMDIGMPVMDGFDAARELRRQGSQVTLVALTGWGQTEDKEATKAAGFDYHLVKPVGSAALRTLLADLVSAPTP